MYTTREALCITNHYIGSRWRQDIELDIGLQLMYRKLISFRLFCILISLLWREPLTAKPSCDSEHPSRSLLLGERLKQLTLVTYMCAYMCMYKWSTASQVFSGVFLNEGPTWASYLTTLCRDWNYRKYSIPNYTAHNVYHKTDHFKT